MKIKTTIENTIADTVSNFLYYDRKGDEVLPRGAIEDAIDNGEITKQEIIDAFIKEINARLK